MEELQLNILNNVEQRELYYNVPNAYFIVKRVFDVLFSLFCLLALSPVLVLLAAAVKISTRGAVLQGFEKYGYLDRVFTMYKFRTSHLQDEKPTKFGAFMKKTRLDELPQLLNVLAGSMSIVGPRPWSSIPAMQYESWYHLRASVKPGLLSNWRANGRQSMSFNEMSRMDLKYIRERGILYDTKIMIKILFLNKRFIDFLGALVGLILLLPVFILVAIAIKATSRGPVFFKHRRIGQSGREFKVFKFRTMVPNAEELMKQFTPEQQMEFQENFKLKDDPRITWIGKILRKTSLDELPQIINILRGDMSIVGPRPIVQAEVEKYGEHAETVFSVKPGLTGLWQASGRSDTSYEERIKLDLEYISSMSFFMDFRIIFLTFLHVIKREGAY